MLIPPMLTDVALEVPSEFWLLFWLVLPEVPTAAWPLVLPWFWTALRTVVGLSADTGRTMSSMVAKVIADSARFMCFGSPKWPVPRSDDPGGGPRSPPPGPWTLLHYGLLRDKRLAVVLVRLRTLTNRRLPNRVTNVALVVDGGGDVLRRATGGLATAELLDQHAENVTVVDKALVVVPDVRHTEILAADVDTAVGALPVRSDTGSLIAGVGRAGPGCITVVLGSPGRRGLRVATASSTRRRSRCTGVDAGVVGSTRATATGGRGTTGTASATSTAVTADGTSTTRPGVTTLSTDCTVTRRGGR